MSKDWMSAKEALDVVSERYSHARDAEIAIFRFAKENEIEAKVRRLTFVARGKKVEHHNIDVPLAFWESMLLSSLNENFYEMSLSTRYADWISGDFSIAIDKIPYELRDVTFDRAGIEAMFPTSEKAVSKFTAKAESDCRSWLSEQFVADPQKVRSKPAFWADAKAKFPKLSERAFSRVWADVAPEQGRNLPGAKIKSPH